MSPPSMRRAPNHSTPTLDALMMNSSIGNISAISRPARSETSVRPSLTSSNRSTSRSSRTKARTTRMPVICSRSTELARSMRSCMVRNRGTIFHTTVPTLSPSAGRATTTSHARPVSCWRARMMPPTIVIGAATANVQAMTTSIWTCCTSLVMRVISDGAPNWLTSRAEKSVTRWNRSPRTSRPKPIATRAL